MVLFNSIKDKVLGSGVVPGLPKTVVTKPEKSKDKDKGEEPAPEPVDVEAKLEAIVKSKGQKLDWRNSIVDFMKALDMDSSLAARKTLAAELKYSGTAADGSAEKNIWLHKALMKALSENGGKLPEAMLK